MKRTQFIELLHNIRKTFVSFFSIAMFVALGIAVFLGITWGPRALEHTVDTYTTGAAFHDFEITYPYGIGQDDLDRLSALDGVSDVEGSYLAFETFHRDGAGYIARVQSLTGNVDRAQAIEGTLPTRAGEVAVDSLFARTCGIGVGDTIEFDADATDGTDPDGMQYLEDRTYTVTAIVTYPTYISTTVATRGISNKANGGVDCYLLLAPESFDTDAYDGCYPVALVRCSNLQGLFSFGEGYSQASSDIRNLIDTVGGTCAKTRFQTVYDRAQTAVDEGQAKVDAGQTAVETGQQRIADAEAQLAQGRATYQQQVAAAQADLDAGLATLQEKQATYDQGRASYDEAYGPAVARLQQSQSELDAKVAQLTQGRDALARAETLLSSYQAQADALKATYTDTCAKIDADPTLTPDERTAAKDAARLTYSQGLASLSTTISERWQITLSLDPDNVESSFATAWGLVADAHTQLDSYQAQADAAQAQIDDGWNQLAAAKSTLDSAASQLSDGWAAYDAGVAQLAATIASTDQQLAAAQKQIDDAKVTLAESRTQLDEGRTALEAGKVQLSQLKDVGWTVAGRVSNGSQLVVTSYQDVADRLRFTLAALFMIVGLLVCYSAVSRIVREQVVSIGTKKALGLRGREITISYLCYSALAVALGVVLGALIAFFVVEGILNHAAANWFSVGRLSSYFSILDTLAIGGVELVLICLATWFACRSLLRRQAVDLLKGAEPPKGTTRFYEGWKVWQKLPLYTQSIVNNFFNDRGRVFGTLIGIAGCTALVVTAVTLSADLEKTFTTQYARVSAYDVQVALDTNVDDAAANVTAVLDDEGVVSTPIVHSTMILQLPDGSHSTIALEVPQDEDTFQQLFHLNSMSGGTAQIDSDGVWVSEAYAEHMGAKVGDTITVSDTRGNTYDLTIEGFFEYHLNHNEMVMDRSLYEETFGTGFEPNTVLVASGPSDKAQLRSALEDTDGYFTLVDDQARARKQFDSFQQLTRAMVYIYLAVSALMAFIVLLNLDVMFIEEKKRDLIVLMINGFSLKDAKRYIYRDNIALTLVGTFFGVLLGMLMGYLSVKSIEFAADSYVLTPSLLACLAGIGASFLFSFIVSLIALRRIPRFKLTDIGKM